MASPVATTSAADLLMLQQVAENKRNKMIGVTVLVACLGLSAAAVAYTYHRHQKEKERRRRGIVKGVNTRRHGGYAMPGHPRLNARTDYHRTGYY